MSYHVYLFDFDLIILVTMVMKYKSRNYFDGNCGPGCFFFLKNTILTVEFSTLDNSKGSETVGQLIVGGR